MSPPIFEGLAVFVEMLNNRLTEEDLVLRKIRGEGSLLQARFSFSQYDSWFRYKILLLLVIINFLLYLSILNSPAQSNKLHMT
jgi:hypothetical protein